MNKWKMCRERAHFGFLDELRAAQCKSTARRKAETSGKRGVEPDASTESKKPPARRVRDGQQHIKARLLTELGPITETMLEKAKNGGTGQLKLLWELGKLDENATVTRVKSEPSLSRILMRELREREATKKQTATAQK